MSEEAPICCPHCNEPLAFEVVSQFKNESRIKASISPHPGELLTAKNAGEYLVAVGELLKSAGRSAKVPTEVLVEKIETDKAGTIVFHLLLARFVEHHHSAANKNRRQAARDSAKLQK